MIIFHVSVCSTQKCFGFVISRCRLLFCSVFIILIKLYGHLPRCALVLRSFLPLFIISSKVVAASCYGYACHRQGLGSFFRVKRNRIELSRGKLLQENFVQSAFQQTLGDKFTFQQNNNLKHKAKHTLELLAKLKMNVPEWPSYSLTLIGFTIYGKT